MIVRSIGNKDYKLVYSTEERVGSVLCAIRQIDVRLQKPKRPRFTDTPLHRFEENLKQQITNFKNKRKCTKI